MADILVSGYYGFQNAGDEAILGGIVAAVRAIDPTVGFTVISGDAPLTRRIHGLEAISRGNLGALWRAMSHTRLLLSGGGGLLQDVTGVKSIPYYLGVASLGKLRGLPVMFYAQGVGPVNGRVGKRLVRSVGNLMDRITVRDPESEQALRSLGVNKSAVSVTADAAFALGPADPAEAVPILQQFGVTRDGRPLIGVAIRRWRLGKGQMEAALAKGLDQVARADGVRILFIPMQQPHDVAAARAVAAQMQQPVTILEGDFSYRQVQALIGSCDVLVGMRYHALVFATMAGVPLVGLSYDPKNDSFLRLLNQRAVGTASQLDAGTLTKALKEALRGGSDIQRRYEAVVCELAERSRSNARIALELMNRWKP